MKTVKIRAAVAVDPFGNYNVVGWSHGSDENAMSLAVEAVESGEARYFITAELPVPEMTEVEAEVESP
jgi:thioesterase domain-containing protein